jgi:hypothetical protein
MYYLIQMRKETQIYCCLLQFPCLLGVRAGELNGQWPQRIRSIKFGCARPFLSAPRECISSSSSCVSSSERDDSIAGLLSRIAEQQRETARPARNQSRFLPLRATTAYLTRDTEWYLSPAFGAIYAHQPLNISHSLLCSSISHYPFTTSISLIAYHAVL